jgi:Fe-S cluster biosynthesis and repair protein YggX
MIVPLPAQQVRSDLLKARGVVVAGASPAIARPLRRALFYSKPRACKRVGRNLLGPITMNLGATRMAHTVFCVRNKKEMEGLDEPPFDSEFGQKIFKNVSKAAWAEWVERQKMLLNEYRLQPWTPQAQQFLVEQMEEFFFGSGSALPSEFVPPTH